MEKKNGQPETREKGEGGNEASGYQNEPVEARSYMINAMSPGARAIAEFKEANARAAKEPTPEPASAGGGRGTKAARPQPKPDQSRP
ncbi:MAG TPA: hypothetical protein VGL40_01950 [Bacillota bacterium]|jgi:hypothetical protein